MMRSRLVQLLLVLTALWLPLQAVAAVAMPFCKHDTPQRVVPQLQHEEMAMHCEHGGGDAPSVPAADSSGDSGHACGACSFCQMAGSAALPMTINVALQSTPARDFAAPAGPVPVSYIPDQPQRPPRTLA